MLDTDTTIPIRFRFDRQEQNEKSKSNSLFRRTLLLFLAISCLYPIFINLRPYSIAVEDVEFWAFNPNNYTNTVANTTTTVTTNNRTFHIINCLSGGAEGFIDEWEVNLKSVLMNAPLDSNLHLHVIGDDDAVREVQVRIDKAKIDSTRWRNALTITVTNIEGRMLEGWRAILVGALSQGGSDWMVKRIGIGGYFRLFAHQVILNYTTKEDEQDLHRAVYMDTDVVVFTGLNHLIESLDTIYADYRAAHAGNGDSSSNSKQNSTLDHENHEYPLITWRENSGFIAMDIVNLHRFWDRMEAQTWMKSAGRVISDQELLQIHEKHYPDDMAYLPDAWYTHIGHGYRKEPQMLFDQQHDKEVGFVHFTGSTKGSSYFSRPHGLSKFCLRGGGCDWNDRKPGGDMEKFDRTWGRAGHYVQLPWPWALYQGGKSRIRLGDEGYEANIVFRTA